MMVMVANRTGVEVGHLAGRFPGILGHLYSPGAQRGPWPFLPYALDNGAYVAWATGKPWGESAWRQLVEWAAAATQPPLWCLAPDVVTNRGATLAKWDRYEPLIRSYGFTPAFAVQDGMTFADAPDDAVLFLGGTIDWKETAIEPWCARFPGRVHVGRVNAWPRLWKSYQAGAISVDGTRWFTKNTGQADALVEFCRRTVAQGEIA